ncbi:MAG: hypothetical protein HFE82_09600 [Erysipelotrichaceae bacterium]|nr:hypothetical protein [Erysipelotrichaceae bacterium]
MAAIEVIIKPITSKKAIRSIKKALLKSSLDKAAVEQAKKQLASYGFQSK